MAYTTINKSTDYFNTVTYSGNGSATQAITGVGHQPDLVWIKSRSNAESHMLSDAVRGSTKRLRSDTTNAEDDLGSNGIQSFNADGFTAGDGDAMNASGQTYASWNWKANGAGSANTDGSINSTVSVNQTAGFSIVKWTGTSATGTVGHGLNSVPKTVWVKSLANAEGMYTYWQPLGNTKQLLMSSTSAQGTTILWNNTTPTSSVFSVGNHDAVNGSGDYIAYCFAEKVGYSKFGSYVGNNNADGNFVYLGFKPAFIIAKNATSSGYSWELFDNKRNTTDGVGNVIQKRLYPDSSAVEGGSSSTNFIDFLSNGFKIRRAGDSNENGSTYIYMAFAEAPLVGSNNVPCTAR